MLTLSAHVEVALDSAFALQGARIIQTRTHTFVLIFVRNVGRVVCALLHQTSAQTLFTFDLKEKKTPYLHGLLLCHCSCSRQAHDVMSLYRFNRKSCLAKAPAFASHVSSACFCFQEVDVVCSCFFASAGQPLFDFCGKKLQGHLHGTKQRPSL